MTAPERLLVDTDILIHLLKKHPATVARFLQLVDAGTRFLLSPVVVAEVYAGAFPREHKDVAALLHLFQRIDIDCDAGEAAGRYANQLAKAHNKISLEDYLLAASARQHRCPLWTGNRKHYPMTDITLFDPA